MHTHVASRRAFAGFGARQIAGAIKSEVFPRKPLLQLNVIPPLMITPTSLYDVAPFRKGYSLLVRTETPWLNDVVPPLPAVPAALTAANRKKKNTRTAHAFLEE